MNAKENQTILSQFVVQNRAVLYARVSGDDRGKEGRNLQGQLEMGREYAAGKGYHIVAELSEDDRGASGANIDLPQLNRIREMAHAGQFDVLIVRELDRLSRNLAKQLIVEEELKRAGVVIEYVLGEYDDSPEGRLSKHIRATIAEYEREKIKERMTRGRRLSAKNGNVIVSGRPPYGYREIKRNGKRNLAIVEDEARIIKNIFDWYLTEELSMGKISQRLTRLRVPTHVDTGTRLNCRAKKQGYGKWSKATVGDILNSEVYTGIWRYGKKSKNGSRWVKNQADYTITVQVPPIISRTTWEAAKKKRKENKQNSKRNTKAEYLLSKRCQCGRCGYKMHAIGGSKPYRYYRCIGNSDPERQKCDLPLFPVAKVDAAVWAWLESIFTNAAVLKKSLADYQANVDKINEPLRRQIESADLSIKKQTLELTGLLADLDALRGRDAPKAREVIYNNIEQVERTIEELGAERDKLKKKLASRSLTPEKAKTIEEYAAEVRRDLETVRGDFEGRRRIIEMLEVEATLSVENGEKIAYARCYLGEKRLPVASVDTVFILC